MTVALAETRTLADRTDLTLAWFWLSERWRPIAMLVALLTSFVLLMLAFTPLAPGERVYGVVEGFGLRESDEGSYPLGHVVLNGRHVTVRLPRGHSCNVGSRISLQRYRSLVGHALRADPTTACGPPSPLRAGQKGL